MIPPLQRPRHRDRAVSPGEFPRSLGEQTSGHPAAWLRSGKCCLTRNRGIASNQTDPEAAFLVAFRVTIPTVRKISLLHHVGADPLTNSLSVENCDDRRQPPYPDCRRRT
jgi:hypothetical protein